jgi:hypothetical protein
MQALTNATTATTNSTIELILSAVPALVMPLLSRQPVQVRNVPSEPKQSSISNVEVPKREQWW